MSRLKIGVDIDGTVYPWTVAANEAVMARYGCPDPGEHTHWDYLKAYLGSDDRWRWIWTRDGARDVFGRADLIYGDSASVINALAREHDVHFVTHRNPERLTDITGAWIRTHFVGYKGVHVLDNSVDKDDVCAWDVFIDDKIETLERFARLTGSQPLMPVRPWNESFRHFRVQRFATWSEVPAMIDRFVSGVAA